MGILRFRGSETGGARLTFRPQGSHWTFTFIISGTMISTLLILPRTANEKTHQNKTQTNQTLDLISSKRKVYLG